MSKGGFLELSSSGGRILCNKTKLNDFEKSGFWLDTDGFHLGDSNNYFYATPTFTGFYSYGSGVKISGNGIDVFAIALIADPNSTENYAAQAVSYMKNNEGAIHFGWNNNYYSTPYLRFGFGSEKNVTDPETGVNKYLRDAGVVKKYTHGIWIGSYGANTGQATPEDDTANSVGIFCRNGVSVGGEWLPATVYRMETVNGQKVYEPARYARFA